MQRVSPPQLAILRVIARGSHKHAGGVSLDALRRKDLIEVIDNHWPTRQFCGHFNDYGLTDTGRAVLLTARNRV